MPTDKKLPRNVGGAARAIRRGGRSLAELTGNPDDAKINPKPSLAQEKAGDLARGFGLIGGKRK